MKIGIFTYGTRGDLQPYIALALRLKEKGHEVTLSATEDFKDWVEGFGISFVPLFGHAESMMNGPEGQSILKSGNPLQLMKYYFKVLHDIREPLRKTYYEAIEKVDYIIANSMTIPIVSAIAEKQEKPLALTYFMPPMVPTRAFPIADFDFFNFPWYNRMTYQIAQAFFWTLVKKDCNEYRRILGLAPLRENLLRFLDKQKILDLYCISPELISRPDDWESHHQITGFLTLPKENRENHTMDQVSPELMNWLNHDDKPIYIGFGSNGIGDQQKWLGILSELLDKTQERILFCTGWSLFDSLPSHKNLFVAKYVNHEAILPRCKIGIFHGGAGTLATMLRNNLPVIILSL